MTDPVNSDAALDARECFMLIRSIARNEGFGNIEGAATKGLAALAAAAERADEAERAEESFQTLAIRYSDERAELQAALLAAQQERDEAYERGYERGAEEATNKVEARAEATNTRLRALETAVRRNYDAMAEHYGDTPEEWWPQVYEALAALAQDAEQENA